MKKSVKAFVRVLLLGGFVLVVPQSSFADLLVGKEKEPVLIDLSDQLLTQGDSLVVTIYGKAKSDFVLTAGTDPFAFRVTNTQWALTTGAKVQGRGVLDQNGMAQVTLQWPMMPGVPKVYLQALIKNSDYDRKYAVSTAKSVTGAEELPKAIYMWSGGCSHEGTQPEWNRYCTDSSDFNTASNYLDIAADGTIVIKKDGFYRIHIWSLTQVERDTEMRLLHNSNTSTLTRRYYQTSWNDMTGELTWLYHAGDRLAFEMYNPGGDYHNGSGLAFGAWSSDNAQSRLQISYIGMAMPR